MAKKKANKKKARRKTSRPKAADGPNRHPEAVLAVHKAAAAARCKFLGKYFDEGATICYDGSEWICSAGTWEETGNSC